MTEFLFLRDACAFACSAWIVRYDSLPNYRSKYNDKKKKTKKNADDWSDISIRQHEHAIDYISRAFLYIFYWS